MTLKDDAIGRVSEHFARLAELMARKNRGYTGHDPDPWANFREVEPLTTTEIGLMARTGDKWNRLKSLMLNPANDQVDEDIFETIDDMINYLAIMYDVMYERKLALAKMSEEELAAALTGMLEAAVSGNPGGKAEPEPWWRCRASYGITDEPCNARPDTAIHASEYPQYDHDFI